MYRAEAYSQNEPNSVGTRAENLISLWFTGLVRNSFSCRILESENG